MKKYFVLGLLMSVALSMSAREYVKGEKVYVNVKQSDAVGDWSKDGAKVYFYLYQSWNSSGPTQWLEMTKVDGYVYAGTFTQDALFDRVIVVRGTAGNWGSKWNQTCNIEIPDNNTDVVYLEKFVNQADGCEWNWKNYAPAVSQIKDIVASQTAEVMNICAQAVGDPISLKAKLKADKSDYDYANVKGHGWYQSKDGNTWTSIDTYAGTTRDGEGDVNIMHTIESGVKYLYLHSNKPAGCRLINVVQQTKGCALDCEITSFETAISAVNADDSTYTLDGMVAFGIANGKLVIECDGKSVTIDDPKSPQSFSLPGVPAATENGKKTTATAYFKGDEENCKQTIEFDVPNATEGVEKVTMDSLAGQNFVLEPKDLDPANAYVWLVKDEKTGKTDTVKGATQILTVNAFSSDSTLTYTYKEYYPAAGSMDDMMENGGYEENNSDKKYGEYGKVSTISEYNFWGYLDQTGTTAINFYANSPAGVNKDNLKENGFAVIRNSHNFAPSYATVKAREGSNFALFDAATGTAGGNKKAWYANSEKNTKLKLQKGTTYVLSFWAANVNNYGEMDNAARFVFRIEYNGHVWNSDTLDLSKIEFRNNIWHQHSQTFFAAEDCDDVTISVVNLNTNTLNIGNDFALDDIQFHPISSVSKVVKSQQVFVVTAHEPKVDAFTATVQPVACDGTDYTIAMHVVYQNPKGQLIIKDKTTNTEYPYDVPAVAFDTQATLDKNIVITTNEPTHEWEAYFADWTTAKKEATTIIPGFPRIDTVKTAFSEPGCTDLYTTLTFDLDYTYQQGDLTYWVDGISPKGTATFTAADKSKLTLNDLAFAQIPADGKNTHVLHVSFDGANSCVKDYTLPAVPFSPVINSVVVSGVPATVLCPAQDYEVTVTITTPYDATGRNIVLTYDDKGAQQKTIAATGTSTVTKLTLHTIAGAAQAITAAYEATPTCTKTSDDFTPPVRVSCIKDEATVCEGESYHWDVTNQDYTRPVGIDTIVSGYDSLILTVQVQPKITIGTMALTCDSASEIRIPFTVTGGAPDTYDIAVDGAHYAGAVDGSDIVFTLATMTAGDYSAVVTVGTAGTNCESTANVNFTIAISGQLLSKWTDVLFVSNKDNRYTGYQWIADGVDLPGQTLQYIYDPEGMSGTTVLYQCRLTTTDGETLITCPQTFDEVTPSRTVTSGGAAQVMGIYDTMGRPVSGKLTRGVYIVVTEIDGERVTTKTIIHD